MLDSTLTRNKFSVSIWLNRCSLAKDVSNMITTRMANVGLSQDPAIRIEFAIGAQGWFIAGEYSLRVR